MKKFIPLIFLVAVLIVPVLVGAQDQKEKPIIPTDCGNLVGGKLDRECDYNDLLKLVNNVINWIIMISMPVAAGVFAWAGFKYMTTGIVDQKAAARKMLQSVFIGFVFILSAWIIVTTITKALLNQDFADAVPIEDSSKK